MPVRRVVRRAQSHQLVQGQSQAVELGPGVAPALKPLGGHVANRAHDVADFGQVIRIRRLGQPEVRDPNIAPGVQQQVRRLDVAVEDPLAIGILQGLGNLKTDPGHALEVRATEIQMRRHVGRTWQDQRRGPGWCGAHGDVWGREDGGLAPLGLGCESAGSERSGVGELAGRQRPGHGARGDREVAFALGPKTGLGPVAVAARFVRIALARARSNLTEAAQLLQDGVQAHSLDVLHHVIMGPLQVTDPEDGHDVGVVQPARGLGLALEPLDLFGVVQGARRQHLERDATAQQLLFGLVNDAHPAAADLADDPETGDRRERLRGRKGRHDVHGVQARSFGLMDRAVEISGCILRRFLCQESWPVHLEALDQSGILGASPPTRVVQARHDWTLCQLIEKALAGRAILDVG